MRKLLVVLLCFMLGVSGCASKYGEQITTVKYYPDCYAPIAELRKSEKNVGNKVIGGAMVGALAGALIGAATTGRASGALAGAAIGAAAGGLTGMLPRSMKNIKTTKPVTQVISLIWIATWKVQQAFSLLLTMPENVTKSVLTKLAVNIKQSLLVKNSFVKSILKSKMV